MRNTVLAWIAESLASRASLASVMTRLAPAALVTALALIAFDGSDAAQKKNGAATAPPGEIRFNGSVLVPAGTHTAADVRSVARLPLGRAVRRGSAGPNQHNPLRTVVVLPARKTSTRVVLITYD